jgi:hypothetical protein
MAGSAEKWSGPSSHEKPAAAIPDRALAHHLAGPQLALRRPRRIERDRLLLERHDDGSCDETAANGPTAKQTVLGLAALRALAAIAEAGESVPVLVGLLDDPVVADHAITELANFGRAAASAVPLLVDRLERSRSEPYTPDAIVRTLAVIAPDSPLVQERLLLEATRYASDSAAFALANIGPCLRASRRSWRRRWRAGRATPPCAPRSGMRSAPDSGAAQSPARQEEVVPRTLDCSARVQADTPVRA